MKKSLAILLLSASAFASIGKVVSYPARHPKKSGYAIAHVAKKSGHIAKKVLY